MSNWTPADWASFFIALGTLVSAILSAIAAFAAHMARLRGEQNSQKIDDNTNLTRQGTAAATANARAAANAAGVAADKTDDLAKQLNGALTTRIHSIVSDHTEPIARALTEHVEQDERNMSEIRQALLDLKAQRK